MNAACHSYHSATAMGLHGHNGSCRALRAESTLAGDSGYWLWPGHGTARKALGSWRWTSRSIVRVPKHPIYRSFQEQYLKVRWLDQVGFVSYLTMRKCSSLSYPLVRMTEDIPVNHDCDILYRIQSMPFQWLVGLPIYRRLRQSIISRDRTQSYARTRDSYVIWNISRNVNPGKINFVDSWAGCPNMWCHNY